jgi:exopolysaccharide biosynthesis polyprenyl glycosylphosphotransferase
METSSPKSNLIIDSVLSQKTRGASRALSRRAQWLLYTFALIVSDGLAVGLAFRVAYFVRFELSLDVFYLSPNPPFAFYQRLVFLLIPLWLVIFALAGLYNRQKLLGGTEEYASVFNATTAGMFTVIAVGFLDPGFIFARAWLLLAWGFAFLFTSSARFFLRRVVYFFRKRGLFLSRAVIIGANNEGRSLAEQLISWKTSGLLVLGFIDEKLPAGTAVSHGLPVLGAVDSLDSLVANYSIEELILASSADSSRDRMVEIYKRYGTSKDINVRMSSGLYEILTTGLTVKEFAYVPLVGVNKVRLTGLDQFTKMLLDYSIALLGLIILFPIFLLIGLLIKLDSSGPVIFRRRVMGVSGRQFDAYKFRTMSTNGDEILSAHPDLKAELAENHKLKRDPRITRVGAFLRKTSLDELPQLFNVLKREMSMVGPRIITSDEVEKYQKWDLNLMTVHPGITGLWQVNGRSDVSYEERVRLDMYYIRNWSIWLDLQILLQTIPVVIKGDGAY